jgi:hypothetical protein
MIWGLDDIPPWLDTYNVPTILSRLGGILGGYKNASCLCRGLDCLDPRLTPGIMKSLPLHLKPLFPT